MFYLHLAETVNSYVANRATLHHLHNIIPITGYFLEENFLVECKTF